MGILSSKDANQPNETSLNGIPLNKSTQLVPNIDQIRINEEKANKPAYLVPNVAQIKMDEEKAANAIKDAQIKEEKAKLAAQNEESAKKLAEQLKNEATSAFTLASQVLSTPSATQEVQQHLVDNANNLADKAQIAQYEASKASEERIKAVQAANAANQQAIMAKELINLNNTLDTSTKISNKVTKGTFKLVNNFQLKCPDGFIQQGINCGHLIEISNSSFGEGDVEGFKNTKQSNSLLILIILFLIIVLIYRNKEFVKKSLNISF